MPKRSPFEDHKEQLREVLESIVRQCVSDLLASDDMIEIVSKKIDDEGLPLFRDVDIRDCLIRLYGPTPESDHEAPERPQKKIGTATNDDVPCFPDARGAWPPGTTHELVCGGRRGYGRFNPKSSAMTLLAGSNFSDEWTGNEGSLADAWLEVETTNGAYEMEDGERVLSKNLVCKSAAVAASMVVGRSMRTDEWVDAHANPLRRTKRQRTKFSNGLVVQFEDGRNMTIKDAGETKASAANSDLLSGTALGMVIRPKREAPLQGLPQNIVRSHQSRR